MSDFDLHKPPWIGSTHKHMCRRLQLVAVGPTSYPEPHLSKVEKTVGQALPKEHNGRLHQSDRTGAGHWAATSRGLECAPGQHDGQHGGHKSCAVKGFCVVQGRSVEQGCVVACESQE